MASIHTGSIPTASARMTATQGMWVIGYGSLIFKPPPLFSFRVGGTLEGFVRRFWQSSADHRGTAQHPGRVVTLVSLEDLKQKAIFHNDLAMYELNELHSETDLVTESLEGLPIKTTLQKVLDLRENDLRVWGVAYYIAPENVAEVKAYLDEREQDGYTTHEVHFRAMLPPREAGSGTHGPMDARGTAAAGGEVYGLVYGPEYKPAHFEVLAALPKTAEGHYIIHSMIYIGTVSNASFVGPEPILKTAQVIKTSRGTSGDNYEYLVKLVHAIRALASSRSRDHYLEDLLHMCESK